MIGNDLVDFRLAKKESNWRREGFLQKVFNATELEFILNTNRQDEAVWLLWSMKEAAYKAHQRKYGLPPRLNWQAQKCWIDFFSEVESRGRVYIGDDCYITYSELSEDRLYTYALDNPDLKVINGIFEDAFNRRALLEHLEKKFSLHTGYLRIQKDSNNIPVISSQDGFTFTSFSLTDHGRYSAYIFSLMNCELAVKHS